YYQRQRKHKLFCKRAGIEPTIGHLKSDYRLGRNFYKGLLGDAINVMLAAAAYNFKRAMKALWLVLEKISETLHERGVSLKYTFSGSTN
ncbi:MAG: transposase, partial [Bacteroides sp.]|nr:transposase [Bacteroides sp.]